MSDSLFMTKHYDSKSSYVNLDCQAIWFILQLKYKGWL